MKEIELKKMLRKAMKSKILKKFNKEYSYNIETVNSNPYMANFKGNHFKVTIKENKTSRNRSFFYSMGIGIKDTSKETILLGLLSCLNQDKIYVDLEEFDGLGYEGKEAINTYKAVCNSNTKANALNLLTFLEDNLTKKELEFMEEN